MSQQNSRKVIPVSDWESLYISGNHTELSYQFLHYLHRFGQSSQAIVTPYLREELSGFLYNFAECLIRPDFKIPENEIQLYIHFNGAIAYLAASTDFVNTDQWLRQLDQYGAPAIKKLILYSLRNRYRPSVEALFLEEPALTSYWYAKQFMASNIPAQRWLLENARSLYASMPDDYQVMSSDCVLAGYFAITYLDPENERPFKQKLNAAIRRCSPVIRPARPRRMKSIAIITKRWFRGSAVYRALYPYLESLVGNYELILVNLARTGANIETGLFDSVINFPALRDVGRLSAEQRQVVEDQDWGMVYYPDIGMDVETVYLANQRLAPIQIMGYGHPASTHGSEIDYFIAGQESEIPELAEKYFSERLVLLPGIGMIPVWPKRPIARSRRKTDKGIVSINCPWTILKINAEIVDVLRDIVAKSPVRVRFRFFSGHDIDKMGAHPVYQQDLAELLGPDVVELYGIISYQEFMSEMSNGDLTLVAYPFGGFNTVIDSLHAGVPVIAWEGVHGYNRFPPALLRRAGFPELVAASREEFMNKALHLIRDPQYRAAMSARIEDGNLDQRITADLDPCDFKRAIDYLVNNHESLVSDPSRQPIFIS